MIELELLDSLIKYESSGPGAEDIIRSINETVTDSGMLIDCMDIDGLKVYDDYEQYIIENVGSIHHIKVDLVTKDELIGNILDTTYSYIEGALPRMQKIIDSLYTGEKDAALIDDLADLIEGITWMYSIGKELLAMNHENEYLETISGKGYGEAIERLENSFAELKDAIMNMDYILIADLLNYEILDVFNLIRAILLELGPIKNQHE